MDDFSTSIAKAKPGDPNSMESVATVLRLAACTAATIELRVPSRTALRMATRIDQYGQPHVSALMYRDVIVYRDAPMPRWEVALLTFSLGLSMFGFMGDAVLALIDLARPIIAAVQP